MECVGKVCIDSTASIFFVFCDDPDNQNAAVVT